MLLLRLASCVLRLKSRVFVKKRYLGSAHMYYFCIRELQYNTSSTVIAIFILAISEQRAESALRHTITESPPQSSKKQATVAASARALFDRTATSAVLCFRVAEEPASFVVLAACGVRCLFLKKKPSPRRTFLELYL